MSTIRVLAGTRKGAFILTSDGQRRQWEMSGPYFGGWEIYHVKGSPVNPHRLYASQTSSWFGRVLQRSDHGGKIWETVGNEFVYEGTPGGGNFGRLARPTPPCCPSLTERTQHFAFTSGSTSPYC
jgi:hypothetical protein